MRFSEKKSYLIFFDVCRFLFLLSPLSTKAKKRQKVWCNERGWLMARTHANTHTRTQWSGLRHWVLKIKYRGRKIDFFLPVFLLVIISATMREDKAEGILYTKLKPYKHLVSFQIYRKPRPKACIVTKKYIFSWSFWWIYFSIFSFPCMVCDLSKF